MIYEDEAIDQMILPAPELASSRDCFENLTWTGSPHRIPEVLVEPALIGPDNGTLYIYVYTAIFNFDERQNVRDEYIKYIGIENSTKARLIFIIGTSAEKGEKGLLSSLMLTEELQTKQDLLQLNITDTYVNLGYKAIGFFNWVLKKRKLVQFVAKIDDDKPETLKRVFQMYRNILPKDTSNLVIYCGLIYADHDPFCWKRK